jgi:uncharacterized protein (DUF433 family)
MTQPSKEIKGLVRPDNVDAGIESVPEIRAGMPVFKGTRITVHTVEARLLHDDSLDEIAAEKLMSRVKL